MTSVKILFSLSLSRCFPNVPYRILSGLKLVCDDLKACTDDRNLDHCETLLDVQSACRTAVEILNDLLCFDKLESGILELHKHEVPAVPFITDCVNMFASQAREAEVTITHTSLIGDIPTDDNIVPYFDAEDLSDYLTPNLLHSDIVTMDKFKMDQVVRNLISNALKYTPRGGSVTVCASFVPDVVDDTIPLKKSGERSKGSSFRMDVPVLSQQWLRSKGQFVSDKQDLELGIPREPSDMVIEDETGNCERTFRSCESREATAPNSNISTFRQSSITPTGSARAFGDTQDKVLPVINGKLRIVVQDTGVGISESNQVHLFKEIVQFNPEVLQAGGGSGLGLWITSSIVQMHAGTIKVHSDGIGKGSTFTVEIDMQRKRVPSNTGRPLAVVMNTHSRGSLASASLPDEDKRSLVRTDDYCPRPLDLSRVIQCLNAASCDESEHPTSMPTRRCTVPEPRTPPILESKSFGEYDDPPPLREVYDVLVVDDSSLNRKLLCKLFRQSRYTCDEANDGMIAVDKVKARMAQAVRGKYQYDAILMDFVMPVMDGPTATQIIRGLGYTGPIFGVTGNALESDVNYFTSSGVNAVLAKPFDFAHFKKLMKDLGPPSPPPGFGDEV
jgi:signal transduction histidine kinase/CheY-like chemotaxis protein